MNQTELKETIMSVFEQNKVGTLSTVRNDKPHSRYMTFFNDGLVLHTPTNRETHKAEEIDKNPFVHILLGYDGEGYGDRYVEIEGTAVIRDSEDLKHKLWSDRFSEWFEGPDDPEYIVLEIEPTAVRLMNAGEEPQTLEVNS
ncbi:pyridoxamine 5'-phosphate oxidase family protein [Jeotgalibacillus proteolyticus]|uniref:General stress protein n=1 Tax=Jeotgalibacillus proteolyticus TaxID=2082395 RepID=A0A2S5GC89_9BACL|nr:pyridoxamine 5'-phosphate oxidase family protein [Jeotgalibacillus proteolyticus]PPA70609.1 general stress protein [Jeotgalibacillus proteolyticus]